MKDIQDVLSKREKTHGNFSQVAETAQCLKETMLLGRVYTPPQMEALSMICSKLARIYCDIAGYALLVVAELEETRCVNQN